MIGTMNRTRALINLISNVPPQSAVKMAVCTAAVLALSYVALMRPLRAGAPDRPE